MRLTVAAFVAARQRACMAALLLAFPAASFGGAEVVLCKDGRPALPILSGSVAAAAEQLRLYLGKISGAQFVQQPARPEQAGLYVGLLSDFPWLSIAKDGDLGPEGFIIRTDETSVYLLAAEPAGVHHAAVTWLHQLGCRWFFPGQEWEVIPSRPTIVGSWNIRGQPSFSSQRRIWYGFGAYSKNQEDKDAWDRRNRMGGPYEIRIGHTWHGLDPKVDFEQHPEWFALSGGTRRPTKPCYSHPDVIQRAIETALKQAAQGTRIVSMSPPDGLGYCECERCRAVFGGAAPFASHDTLFAKRPDSVLVNITSENLFHMVNEVAGAVAKRHPGTLVGTYAYSAYSHPPSFDFLPNVFVQTTTAFRRTPLSLEQQLAAFGRRTTHLGIREYYSVYQWDWDGPAVAKGSLFLPQLISDLRFYRKNGVTAINAEASNNWAPRGLGYYVAANLLWDVNTDVKALIGDFYEKAFGPAAPAIERYYVRWCGPYAAVSGSGKESALPPSSPAAASKAPKDELDNAQYAVQAAFGRDPVRASFHDLDEAAAQVAGLRGCQERVDHLRMYLHYLVLRLHLEEAAKRGDRQAIVKAVEAETVFGARLMNTNMIHSRPLIGKAFHRRFRDYMEHLRGLPEGNETEGAGKGFRQVRADVPTRDELERLWAEDRRFLGL